MKSALPRYLPLGACLLAFATALVHADETANWPRFRGPNGAGLGTATGVAGEWTAANELWSAELPGPGHGSPVVWDDRLYLLAADPARQECVLLAFDAHTGRELWRHGNPAGDYPMHAANTVASTTPAVDAERVCVTWATADNYWVAAYTHAGQELWKQAVGPFVSSHGFACSPTLVGDIVCVTDDQQEESWVIGLDADTGKERWRTPRPSGKAAYASPCVASIAGRQAIITQSTAAGMAAFDVATGKELWRLPDVFPERCVSSPLLVKNMVLGACGGGGNGKHLVAVELEAHQSESSQPRERFRIEKSVPYVPTPLVVGDLMILWHDRGTVAGMDLATGEKLWEERIGGKFFSSPISVGDAVLAVSNDGEVVSISVTRQGCEVLARNDLGAPTQATPAIAHDRVYFRTEERVLAIGGAEVASLSTAESGLRSAQ